MSPARQLPQWEETELRVGELLLCPWQDADATAIAAAYHDDPEIPRRTGLPYEMTEAQARAYILERREGWNAGLKAAFGIFGEQRRLLGSISLLEIDWDQRGAEVGFWLARTARGRGVAVQAVEGIGYWAAGLGLLQLTATVELTNEASQRVLEQAGFRRKRVAQANRTLHGQSIDEYVYARRLLG